MFWGMGERKEYIHRLIQQEGKNVYIEGKSHRCIVWCRDCWTEGGRDGWMDGGWLAEQFEHPNAILSVRDVHCARSDL